MSLMSRHKMMAAGAEVIRDFERLICAWIFSDGTPSRSRSRSKSSAIASAKRVLTDKFVTTTNLHGWRLCAEGAYAVVERMVRIAASGTGSGLKRRTERRIRKKLCRSIVVQVKVE